MKRICLFIAFCAMVFCVDAARKVTWVIDPGHGGRDVGCEGKMTQEKDITLSVAKELAKLVKKNMKDVRVVLTRERDKFLSLQERCDIANGRGAALFVSIHVNSAPNQFARGTESFFATNVPLKGTQSGKSELLALLLQRQYLSHGREVSRGVKQRELYVCEHTNMPCVLTEIGFISNLNEEAYLNSKDGQRELADAIYQALEEWKEKTKGGSVSRRELRNLRFTHYDPVRVPRTQVASKKSSAKSSSSSEATTAQATRSAKSTPQPQKAKAKDVATTAASAAETLESPSTPTTEQSSSSQQALSSPTEQQDAAGQDKGAGSQEKGTDSQGKGTAGQDKGAASQGKGTAEQTKAGQAPAAGKGKTTATKDSVVTAQRPYFAIQLMNTSAKLKEGDYRLKGFIPTAQIPAGGRFKIIYGHSENYKEIKNELADVRETFPEAFIVAFLGDKQITTAEAIQLQKR
ncbi:MAG: N-acetylmuramoyl-L-alanine amidase [Bacteroidaceae bacterium]|nr:N-acetylmuramoyl-L-alanine amidase [Bacteroidaceae bacterium]